MNRSSVHLMLAVALLLTLTSVVTLRAQGRLAKPSSIAVLDALKVLNALDEKDAVEADITRRRETLQQDTQRRTQEIKSIEADLSILAPDSDAYRQALDKRQAKAIELEVWQKIELQKLESEVAIRLEKLYLSIVESAAKIAQRDGYDVVLYKDPTESAQGRTRQEVLQQIALRKLLYSRPELDLTDQVTQILNNEFNNRKR